MKTPRRAGKPMSDPAASGRGWRPSAGYLAIALALGVAGLIFLLMSSDDADNMTKSAASRGAARDGFATWTPPALPATSTAPGSSVSQEAASSTPEEHREGDADPTRDLSFYLARGEKPPMADVIKRLHEAGQYSGLGAFSPPGTRPPLVGLAVPEDFVLPPGYVRHYQATDDGQRIEAILMYSPDHQFVDANNQPLAIPKDRVVPPEHAPPGMPIRRIEIPAPTEPR